MASENPFCVGIIYGAAILASGFQIHKSPLRNPHQTLQRGLAVQQTLLGISRPLGAIFLPLKVGFTSIFELLSTDKTPFLFRIITIHFCNYPGNSRGAYQFLIIIPVTTLSAPAKIMDPCFEP